MRRLLPSVWLLGAALYTALTLFLCRPVVEDWPLPPATNETVVAKQPLRAAKLIFENETPVIQTAALPASEPRVEQRNAWVQIAGYTAVGRLHPSSASPVLFAYAVGRPLRVIAHEGEFVRVQDLGSGQLGWVKETALSPFTGGYRLREPIVTEPVVAAAEPATTVVAARISQLATPVAAKKVRQPRDDVIAAQPPKETVAATEPVARGLFRRKRDQVQRVAYGSEDNGVAAIMRRAFSRF